jgi:hypothetical protein
VPEATVFRIDLPASQRARQVRLAAQVLTGLAAAACLLALWLSPNAARLAASLAALAALVLVLRPVRPARGRQLAVGDDGMVQVGSADDVTTTVLYCSAGFISLRVAGGTLPIWSGDLPATAWRRLLVACRWPHQRASGPKGEFLPDSNRTK